MPKRTSARRPSRDQGRKAVHHLDASWGLTDAWAALVDKDGWVQDANRSLPGLTRSIDLLALVPESQRDVARAALGNAAHPGLHHRLDLNLDLPEGRRIFDATIAPADGLALVVALDITRRVHEEERLRHSERIMRDTEGISHMGVWYWDITQPHAEWSPELFRIYGLDRTKHVPTYQDYLTRVHPDDVERVKAATERVFQEHVPYSHDERIRHADGSWRYLHTWARPILDDQGELKALMGVCQDITARMEALLALEAGKQRYRAVFEHAGSAMIIDADGTIRSANRACQDLCGACEGDLTGRSLSDLLATGTDLDAALAALGPEPVRLDVRDVQGRDLALHLLGLGDEVLVTLEETGHTRRIADLEAESAWKSQLLRLASHELKNPLTPILMNLHALSQTVSDPEAHLVGRIRAQVERLARLVHDFLDASRLEEGAVPLARTTWDLDALVDAVLAEEGGPVRLERAGSAGEVEGDRDRIRQVLTNLVQNAVRFSPKDGVVTVHVGPGPRVEVRDEGPGVSKDALDHLFQPFSTSGDAASGSGLGLYISRVLVEAHGGRIGAEAGPGGCFWFEWNH